MLNSRLFALVSLVLGLSFDYLFYEKIPGVSFPIYVVLILAILFILTKFSARKPSKETLWLLVPLIFFSAMAAIRASILLTVLNITASLFLLLLIAKTFWEGRIKFFLAGDYLKILFLPLAFLGPMSETIGDLLSWKKEEKNKKTLSQVIKGIVISVPFLIIFVILFSSADLIFQKYLSNIIDLDINPEIVFRLLLILAVTLAFLGAYSYIFRNLERKDTFSKNNPKFLGFIESSILLGSVNILFLIFIAVQIVYLFGGENNISSEGFTYAEYARRGFFELIAAALFSFLLLFGADKYAEKREAGQAFWLKVLSMSLIFGVIIIMASAYLRLSLYEAAYGFTTLRLYSHVFIIFLAVVFSLLLFKILQDGGENIFVARAFAAAVLFLAFMNFFNPDAFIARKNIERFSETGKLDVYYLSSLSEDAMPESIKALEIPDEEIKNNFTNELRHRREKRGTPGWQSVNLSRLKADKILGLKIAELEPYKDY